MRNLDKKITQFFCALLVMVMVFGTMPSKVFADTSLSSSKLAGRLASIMASVQGDRVVIFVYVMEPRATIPSMPDFITNMAIDYFRIVVYEDSMEVGRIINRMENREFGFFQMNLDGRSPGQFALRLYYAPGYTFCQEKIFLNLVRETGGYAPDRRPRFVVTPIDTSVIPPVTPDPPTVPVVPNPPTVVEPPVQPDPPVAPPPPPPTPGRVLRFEIGSTVFTDSGVRHTLEAAPFIADDRTMVPLRVIGEALGATSLAHNAGVITFNINGQAFTMTVGDMLPGNMGVPVIVEGRTFVPLAFIVNEMGAEARWDRSARAAYIYIN